MPALKQNSPNIASFSGTIDKRFLEELDNLELENVTLLDMTDQSQLAVKKRIEIDEPEQQFCCGSPRCPQRVRLAIGYSSL